MGVPRAWKLKTHLLKTQSPKVLPLKPGVDQNIAMQASLTARGFFLELFFTRLPVHSPVFFQNLSRAFPVSAVANTGFRVGLQNKIGHPARRSRWFDAGSRVEWPRNINWLQNTCHCVSGLAFQNREYGFSFPREIGAFYKIWVSCVALISLSNIKTELFNKKRPLWCDDL